ncbi:MAG: hypothetical protein M0Z66_11155 [Thermaerobacter sp.]|nr:hypothetical protein [Thermaerobacter sp.]
MRRTIGIALTVAIVAAAIAMFAVPAPQGNGLTPAFFILLALLVVGLPSAVWLAVSGQPPATPGRLPQVFWIGLLLLALAYCGSAFTMLWPPYSTGPIRLSTASPQPAMTSPQRSLHFSPLPRRAAAAFHTAFPSLVVGRSLKSTSGTYEVWLRSPGSARFRLQARWQGGTIHLENLQFNSDYTPQGREPSLAALRARVQAPKGAFYGPVLFPGYLLYVSLGRDQAWVITRSNAGISAEYEEAW